MDKRSEETRDSVLAGCIRALERGDHAAIERACAEHSDLAPDIRAAAHAVSQLGRLATSDAPIDPVAAAGGRTIGRFEIQRELGRGGAGVVYLARDPKLGRLVALKLLAALPTMDALERFRRETHALALLHHPNVAAIYEVGETEQGVPYFAMEYVDGVPLDAFLRSFASADPRTLRPEQLVPPGGSLEAPSYVTAIVRIGAKIADALDAAHREGVIHRDVKPGNVLIDRAGESHLLDFGLARGLDSQSITRTGFSPGTPLYMAPEQIARESGEIGPCTDVYALGVTLYHLLTLRAPFEGQTTGHVFHQITRAELVAPRKINSAIPRDLETVLLKAIEKDPRRRYASAAAFRDDLLALLQLRPIQARPPGLVRRIRLSIVRRPALTAAILVAVLALTWQLGQSIIDTESHARQAREAMADSRESESKLAAIDHELQGLSVYSAVASAKQRDANLLRRQADAALSSADRLLEQAARWFYPGSHEALRHDQVDSLTHRAELSESAGDHVEASRCMNRAEQIATAAGRTDEWILGTVHLLAPTGDGVCLYLFRYAPYQDLPGRQKEIPRLVPIPADGVGKTLDLHVDGFEPGDECLVVMETGPEPSRTSQPLGEGDLIFRVGRRFVRDGGLFVRSVDAAGLAAKKGVQPFDRISQVQDRRIHDRFTWETVDVSDSWRPVPIGEPMHPNGYQAPECKLTANIEPTARPPVALEGTLRSGTIPTDLGIAVFPTRTHCGQLEAYASELGGNLPVLEDAFGFEVGDLRETLEQNPSLHEGLFCFRAGNVQLLPPGSGLPSGTRLECTAYPLLLSPANRVVLDHPRELRLLPGSYLALLSAPGKASVRYPFVISPHSNESIELPLVDRSLIPPGFVFVPKHSFTYGGEQDIGIPRWRGRATAGGAFIARHEVTMKDWCEFLDDKDANDIGAAKLNLLPLLPGGSPWGIVRTRRGWVPIGSSEPSSPVVMQPKSAASARAYVEWKNCDARRRGLPWTFRLPDQNEWELAARGVDGRSFPWGNEFEFTLCNSLLAFDDSQLRQLHVLASVGSFPTDESPYGLRDMAGSSAEQNTGPVLLASPAMPLSRGGSWVTMRAGDFKAASLFVTSNDVPNVGFRLAADPTR